MTGNCKVWKATSLLLAGLVAGVYSVMDFQVSERDRTLEGTLELSNLLAKPDPDTEVGRSVIAIAGGERRIESVACPSGWFAPINSCTATLKNGRRIGFHIMSGEIKRVVLLKWYR